MEGVIKKVIEGFIKGVMEVVIKGVIGGLWRGFEARQPIRKWRSGPVCTSALTILSTMVSRVSCRLHFITPSKYCERCFSASVTLMSRLL